MAAGAARGEDDRQQKPGAINTGLFTASPAADQAIRSQFVKPSDNAGLRPGHRDLLRSSPDNATPSAPPPAGQQIQTDRTTPSPSPLTGEKTPEQVLADAQASSLRAWDQSRAGNVYPV